MDFPEYLYHYTTCHGLIGILQEKAFWATDPHFLNDSGEVRLGLAYAKAWLEKHQEDLISQGWREKSIERMLKRMDSIGYLTSFVCSFSEIEDSLSQWRAYGGSGGYAIGIKTEHLAKTSVQIGADLVKCIYTHSENSNPVANALNDLLENGDFDLKKNPKAVDTLKEALNRTVISIKSKDFEEEREWRVVLPLTSMDGQDFRSRSDVIVPFVRAPLVPHHEESLSDTNMESPSIRFVLGPSTYSELAWAGLKRLLMIAKVGHGTMWTQTTSVTYRRL